MAIWQFDCYIIPKKNVDADIHLDSENILSWGKQSISVEKVDFLEKQTSWTTDIVQYGKDDYFHYIKIVFGCRLESTMSRQWYCMQKIKRKTKME